MKIKQHAQSTNEKFGYPAEDIHEWIDQFFDMKRFRLSLRRGFFGGWNPYGHRRHLHHKDALPLAVEEFKEKYSKDIIEKVFFQHLKDDYSGYIPVKTDFDDPRFRRKYHRLF